MFALFSYFRRINKVGVFTLLVGMFSDNDFLILSNFVLFFDETYSTVIPLPCRFLCILFRIFSRFLNLLIFKVIPLPDTSDLASALMIKTTTLTDLNRVPSSIRVLGGIVRAMVPT